MQHPRLQKILFFLALLCTLLFPRVGVAQASKVLLTFYMLTASHAALGAPVQYQLTLTNTGTTVVTLESKVSLIAPNRTTCIELDTMPTLNPGQVLGTSGTFKTSDCDSETGAFTLTGQTLSSGVVVMQKIIALTVTPVPANGVYGSIGGRGPDSFVIGYTYDFSTVVANLSKLEPDAFWFVLDNHNWMHPFDDKGRRRGYQDIPKSVTALVDDPFRSLAGELRRAGGFAKDTTPFSEFLWADFLRRRIKRKSVENDFDHTLENALQLARGKEAKYLPGWCGPTPEG